MASITHWKRQLNTDLLQDSVVADAFAPEAVEQHCRDADHQWRDSFWSPKTTLLTLLLQVLDPSKTLRAAVAALLTHLAAQGEKHLPSADPTAYCQARKRLPGEALTRILVMLADRMQGLVTDATDWLGHRVWIVDGSSASMPDEPELQKRFPQPSQQAPGCGFPVAQFVALFCWTTGAIVDVAIDSLKPHELPLFRTLWHHFKAGDVVLGDRAYCAYVDIARLLERGVYCIFRMHQRRVANFRTGQRLGHDDRLVAWKRPAQWLESYGVTRDEFAKLPETLSVRLVRITNTPKGFRSRTIIVATTLIDPKETSADDIRSLYGDRWIAELNFRSLKTHLGMDILRGKSVDVVLKEIVMHLIAYNLIRLLMWHAANRHGRDFRRLSFTGTLHRLHSALPLMLVAPGREEFAAALFKRLLAWIAADILPDRPNRIEPRHKKRRPKQYGWLKKHRHLYRKDLKSGRC